MARSKNTPNLWTQEETILSLDLYLRLSKERKGISGFSDEAKLAQDLASYGFAERTRSAIHYKLENWKAVDPSYRAKDNRTGPQNRAKMMDELWVRYKCETTEGQKAVAQLAQGLREELKKANVKDIKELQEKNYIRDRIDGEEVPEAIEGRLRTVTHINRERDPKLRKRKIEKVLADKGSLSCEACGFDFATRYGSHGEGFIEVHHTKPLATLTEASRITLDDLALLCSNCHRMIHRNPKTPLAHNGCALRSRSKTQL